MALFRELRGRLDEALGFPLALLPDAKDVARAVLSKANGAVLLFADAGEWMTLLHYHSCFKDNEAASGHRGPDRAVQRRGRPASAAVELDVQNFERYRKRLLKGEERITSPA